MDWITDQIAIGNYLEAQDASLLRQASISSVLGLDSTLRGKAPADLGLQAVEIVPLEDRPGNDPRLFRRAIHTLRELLREAPPVLVHCHAGRSRSVVVVAGYLMEAQGFDAEQALARVATRRDTAVTPGLERLLDNVIEGG
jgi:atypical dual specificity phosphatase